MFRIACITLFLMQGLPAFSAPQDDLHTLFSEEWDQRMERNPFSASQRGLRQYDSAVPDVSPDAHKRHLEEDKAFLARLHAIDRSKLPKDDQLNYDLFKFDLKSRIDTATWRPWRIPFLSDSGFQSSAVFSIEAIPFKTAQHYEDYISRLEKMADYVDQNIANMRTGIAENFTMPRAILDNVLPGFQALAVAKAEDSAFYAPFKDLPGNIEPAKRDALLKQGRDALENRLLPAWHRLAAFFENEYMPKARTTLGASELPDGERYYASRIKYYTTLDLGAQEIHQIGLREAKRIRAEMNAIISQIGFEGDFADFLNFLRTDPQFYPKTSQDYLERAAWIAKNADEKLPAYFGLLPRMPYGVRKVPDDIAPNYTTGRYWGPIKGVRGGLYMVNTYALDKRPYYTLPALTVHEAVPGHHLQTTLAREIENVPDFRKNLYVVAFGEGWGLYTEKLGIEMGIYETPYEDFGRLTYEMWRAGRLVVDTGMHALGWTRDEAVRFFRENSALSEHNINTEVDRYISWPGQALGYKMGELKILELRARAEKILGADFDIRAFHDAVLANGSLPLPILEQKIDNFIEKSKAE